MVTKRQISNGQLEFLTHELDYLVSDKLISSQQAQDIQGSYEVKNRFNFVMIILLLGSVLIGLGILSFIASNWQEMSKLAKFTLILASYMGFNIASYSLNAKHPKVARSLTYISVFIFGAGIFLIGQMFNFGGHFSGAFLYWAIGILPMGVLLRDKVIFLFAHGLLLVYINGYFELNQFPAIGLLLTPALYYANKHFNYSKLVTFANNLVALNLLGSLLEYKDLQSTWVFLTFFIIGVVFFLFPIPFNRTVFKGQGLLLMGVFGLILTFRDAWDALQIVNINIYFALIYLLVLLALVRNGNLVALLFFCITIFRFYVDTFYDFMPKSLFFILGGSMLLGFGYYFEKKRKLQGGLGFEK